MKIAIASGKGGVGKSMLASSLAILFSQKRPLVAVDADVDAPNLHLWLGQKDWDWREKISVTEQPEINRALCRHCGRCLGICQFGALSPGPTVNRWFCEGCGACEAVCPAGAITMKPQVNGEIRLKENVFGFPLVSAQLYPGQVGSGKIVDQIKNKADSLGKEMAIIDAPAGTGCPVIAALRDVDYAVLVTEPTPSGFADLKRVLKVVDFFKLPFGLVINRWDLNRPESDKIGNWLKANKEGEFLGRISFDRRIFEAISRLRPIMKTKLPVKEEIEAIYNQLISSLAKKGGG